MDSVVNAAVEEICAGIEDGLTLAALWAKLEDSPSLSSSNLCLNSTVKRAIWTNLLRIPTLRFEPQPSSSELEDAEKLNTKIFAHQSLTDNFVGLYDSQSLQDAQMRVLRLLANARANGVTQTQLAKQLHIDPNNFHYVLRSLECQGLIVKRSAIEKKKQISSHGESKNYPCVATHLVYLHRYAKQLASHQRFEFEITKFNSPDDDDEDADGTTLQTDVHLKDYKPQMKAICEKLAEANGKVLLVSDIKKDLGYCGSRPKQRAWRQISQRLKAHGIVEQFDAKVNGKIEACLRLLDPITTESGNEDKKLNSGKICQVIDQLVELPMEHQIYDIIDAAGSCGITLKEICERLGIELKKSHIRLVNLCYRFGMKVQEEQCLKSKAIRVWTSKNFNPEPEVELICKLDENKTLNDVPDSSKIISEFETSTTSGKLADPAKLEDRGVGAELSCVSPRNTESNFVGTSADLQDLVLDRRSTVSHCKSVSSSAEADNAPSGAFPSDMLKPFSTGSNQRYASLSLSVDNTRRANRILERLKDERFILKSEINRCLICFEKDKSTKVDRKTIDRILTKLQEQEQVKCITVHSPVISEYSRTKDCVVVVHPSMSLTPELFDEIQDRIRSFNCYIRSKSASHQKNDELLPVMEDIQKNQSVIVPDGQASKAEAMRANGFVLAKMIRAKLLHSFIWDCLHRSTSHINVLSSKKCVFEVTDAPHSSSKLFFLEATIKEMPVELFLKVVGSTKNYEEMIEKCKMDLRLSDLPPEEYKCLMDAQATGRLSLVIDILRRLKLIRIVTDLQSRDGVKTPQTHTMELRPYIEEPISNDAASLNFISLDLRPRVRHDFILSNRGAVDEYWRTLENCYATADRKAASYAFPGSVVHELFRFRSWASTRLMTAEQRAELLKHVTKDNLSENISYRDCEKIAKDLNLTTEQVLSMYKSHRRFVYQFKDEKIEDNSPECKGNSSRRRKKKSTELRPAKHARIDDAVTDVVDMHIEGSQNLDVHSGECATHMQEFEESMPQDCIPLISQRVLTKMKPTRLRRFIWSDKTDRQLVIQYVKHRAVLGAKYHRIDWASISDLPASPIACMRRMNLLNSNMRFRKAVNKLCSMLSERYAKQLEKSQYSSLNNDRKQFVRSQSCEGILNNSSPDAEIQITSLNKEAWDDFENKNIKMVLDEILRCKMMAKLGASSQKGQLQYDGWSDANANADGFESQENEEITSAIPCDNIQSHGKPHTFSAQRSRRRRLDKNFTRFLNNMVNVYGQVNESLAISNVVELFKLVFLSTSTDPQAPKLLDDILRRYSQHDLFAAFNYLKEKKVMVVHPCVFGKIPNTYSSYEIHFKIIGSHTLLEHRFGPNSIPKVSSWGEGCLPLIYSILALSLADMGLRVGGTGNERFELSQQFLQSVSKSPFPFNTGKQAVKFSAWLEERGKDLTEVGANLAEDLQCGDIFHLFALVSSGELSISPFLPDNGVGEAEDLRSAKRKSDTTESSYSDKAKKSKSFFGVEGEIISRREKGFPGIIISAHRTTISRADILNLFKDNDNYGQPFEGDFQLNIGQSSNYSLPDHILEITKSSDPVPLEENRSESPWEAMAGYARHLLSEYSNKKHAYAICAEVFRVVYAAIQKAGDQGLSMGEISQVINLPGAEIDVLIVDALQAFGQALKVNAYDTVRVVDVLYRHKYFLTPMSDFHLHDDILHHMHVLNPQNCRTLLELMVLDKHLIVKKMHQNMLDGGPSLLPELIGSKSSQPKLICREHFFANPMSTSLL
ncbi:hypothetical protein GmHk_02G002996 [Glycine max]|nr:hypothetical protein GmHk_02G002996 [Glycine max]